MAPSSAKAQIIHEWQKVEQRKMKKTKKKKQESVVTCPSKTHYHHELAGDDDHNMKKEEEDISSSGCCTPKAERFKIPEILSCPPAPKKTMVYQSNNIRSPIPFFSSPDIDFFFASLRNLSA